MASKKAYDERMQQPVQRIEGEKKTSYDVLENSVKDKYGNVYEKQGVPKGSLPADSKSRGRLANAENKMGETYLQNEMSGWTCFMGS